MRNANRKNSSHNFAKVSTPTVQRSAFDRSFSHKTTFSADRLVPIFYDEALPGDTFNLKLSSFCRVATLKTPILDNFYLEFFFFSVPNRLVWSEWETFINGGWRNGSQQEHIDLTVPHVQFAKYIKPGMSNMWFAPGSPGDYLGLPVSKPGASSTLSWKYDGAMEVSALPFRAYTLIWNEWFRDQNTQLAKVVETSSINDFYESQPYTSLLPVYKKHDYFTSALPWPQKSLLNEGQYMNIKLLPMNVRGDGTPSVVDKLGHVFKVGIHGNTHGNSLHPVVNQAGDQPQDGIMEWAQATTGLKTEEGVATVNIAQLRESFQLQKMFEKDARGGSRYNEVIISHFGVEPPDSRLNRPEFLTAGRIPFNVESIAQTAEGDKQNVVGRMAGNAIAAGSNVSFTKSFDEHCMIMGFCCVRADLTYSQGIPKAFMKKTRYDYYWPVLSHLSEQAILKSELFYYISEAGTDWSSNTEVFGYQERYAEYRYKPSMLTGQFRVDLKAFGTTNYLDNWHLGEKFENQPALNSSFLESNTPIDRVVAYDGEANKKYNNFLLDTFFKMKCVRPMPIYAVPGLTDHF